MSSLPFHVNCPITGQAMCRCTMGTPASIAQRGDDFQRNAKLTFQMWQNQGQLFTPSAQPSVDIPIPQLLRKSMTEPPPKPAPSGFMNRRSAEHMLQVAREAARRAVTRAAYLAGAAGLDYRAPVGFPVDLTNIPKRDVRALEARVRAAEQALEARHAQSLNRIHSMDTLPLPSLASLPELRDRRHSMPAGVDGALRRSSNPPQPACSLQQESRPDDKAAEDLSGFSASPRAAQRTQRGQGRIADSPAAKNSTSLAQRPRIRSNPLQTKSGAACQGKAKQRGGAKAGGQEDGDAWEAAPQKLLRLRVKDVRNTLKERWLQLFWPEDGRWWPGQVLDISCKERKVNLLYKTGEEETDLDLGELIKKGEVAWLSTEEMMKASETAQTGVREGSAQQDALADRETPAESPRQRKRPLDSLQHADAQTPLRHPGSCTAAPALAPPYGRADAEDGALPPLGMAEDYDEMDPFEHWEQVQEQQRQRQMQRSSGPGDSLLPL